MVLFVTFRTSGRFGIISSSWDTAFLVLSSVTSSSLCLLYLLFPGFVSSLGLLFGLAGFTFALALQVCINLLGFFKLLIAGFDTHLQRSFSLRTALVQLGVPVNTGIIFGSFSFTN